MRKLYILPLLALVLMAACASPKEDANNGAQQANANTSAGTNPAVQPTNIPPANAPSQQPQIMPNGSPNTNQSVPLPEVAKVTENKPPPEAKPGATATGDAPKLLVMSRDIDFGKQPKDTDLTKSIPIKNTGKADLEIQSVSPS